MRAAPGAGPRRAQASRGRRPWEPVVRREGAHPPLREGASRSLALRSVHPAQFQLRPGQHRRRRECRGGVWRCWDPAAARVADWARIKAARGAAFLWSRPPARRQPLGSPRGTLPRLRPRSGKPMADRGRGDRGGFGRGRRSRPGRPRPRRPRPRRPRPRPRQRGARRRREEVPRHQARPPRQVGQDQVARADLPLLAPDQGVPDRRLLHEGQAQGRGDADRVGPEADVGGPAHALRLLGRRRRLRRARGPRREGGEGGAARHPRRHPRRQVQPRADPPRLLGRQDRPPPHRAHQADGPVRLRPHPPHPRRPRCAAAPAPG